MLNMEIDKIERISNVRKSSRWYYHGITTDSHNFLKIMQEGLLSENLSGYSRTRDGYNGVYYISLSKDIGKKDSGYHEYIEKYPMLIIDGIKAFKCLKLNCNTIFTKTIIPFRTSGYRDEYQAFNRIDPVNFRGIEAKAYDWASQEKIAELRNLRDLILSMKEFGVSLPVYDYSREEDGIIHELDQEQFLDLSKKSLH